MTTTSPRASAPGSKTKTKIQDQLKLQGQDSGSSPKARGGRPADGKTSRQRVEDAVADRIIELLDQGQLPPMGEGLARFRQRPSPSTPSA